jgi:hypothetical protein
MAREGYLIVDSDLHMMEPDDLWPAISMSLIGRIRRAAVLWRAAAKADAKRRG